MAERAGAKVTEVPYLLPHGTLGRNRTARRRGSRLVAGDRHRAPPIPRPLAARSRRRRERSLQPGRRADHQLATVGGTPRRHGVRPRRRSRRRPRGGRTRRPRDGLRARIVDQPRGGAAILRPARALGCPGPGRSRGAHRPARGCQGRIAEARAELPAARQTFSDLDASPWFARAGDELRSTGLRDSAVRPAPLPICSPRSKPGSRVWPHVGSRTRRSAGSSTPRRGRYPRTCTRSSPSSTSRAGPVSETPSQRPPALVETTAAETTSIERR